MGKDRDLALIALAGIIAVAALISGDVLACAAHLPATAIVAIVGGPSAVAGVALGRLGGPKPAEPTP
jgi:hypothetical protein